MKRRLITASLTETGGRVVLAMLDPEGRSYENATRTLTLEHAIDLRMELDLAINEARRQRAEVWKVKVQAAASFLERMLSDGDENPEAWRAVLDRFTNIRAEHFTPTTKEPGR